ncbi:MAG: TIGR03790 family protein [Planctomycetota bacterium]
MGVALSQSTIAAFPDRPGINAGTGLRALLTTGTDGQVVKHPLASAVDRLHTRFLVRTASLTGGRLVLCSAFDDQGDTVFQMELAPSGQLTCQVHGNIALSNTLSLASPEPWNCVEFGIDAATGTAALWVNGVQAGESLGVSATLSIQQVELGVVRKDHDAVGEIHFDEWGIGDGPLGPVIVKPQTKHADDPARWLVVYNTAESKSRTWAEAYRKARFIPHANLLGLNLPTAETINLNTYVDLLNQIESYLDLNGLRPQILGILLGYRVPGYVDHPSLDDLHPVGSLLHTASDDLALTFNPAAANEKPERPGPDNLDGIRLTARLDAPNLTEAVALCERAQRFDTQSLTAADQLWIDPTPSTPPLETVSAQLMDWTRSLDFQRLRMHTQLSGDPVTEPDADSTSIRSDAFYWGWGGVAPPSNYFQSPSGPRVAYVQLRQPGVEATTLRSANPTHWIDRALAAGYAAAVASSQNTSISALPSAKPFFEALRRGWTLAEAWLVSQPFVRGGMYLVGDPLLTVRTPRQGWDVFGPLGQSENLDPGTPLATLPGDTTTLKLNPDQTPAEQEAAVYLIRRVDEQGRSEASVLPVATGKTSGGAVSPPPTPAWPDHDYWAMKIHNRQAIAQLWLPQRPTTLPIDRIELLDDRGSNPIEVEFDRHSIQVQTTLALPLNLTRYRWRITSPGGLIRQTPWSMPIRQNMTTSVPLTPLES